MNGRQPSSARAAALIKTHNWPSRCGMRHPHRSIGRPIHPLQHSDRPKRAVTVKQRGLSPKDLPGPCPHRPIGMSACQPSGAAAAPQQQAGGSGAAHAAPAAPPSVQPVQAAPPSFATYADEVRASLALLRSLLEELDATGREPDWERLRGRPGEPRGARHAAACVHAPVFLRTHRPATQSYTQSIHPRNVCHGAPLACTLPVPAGIRLDPITWRELTALVADGSERALGSLGRTPLQARFQSLVCSWLPGLLTADGLSFSLLLLGCVHLPWLPPVSAAAVATACLLACLLV